MTEPSQPLEVVRAIIASWPETNEKISHGSPTWWGGRKTFASFHDNHHGDGRLALWIKSTPLEQEAMVEADPDSFFVPPYVGPSGWVGVRLDRGIEWDLVSDILESGYRLVAPARALRQLDVESAGEERAT